MSGAARDDLDAAIGLLASALGGELELLERGGLRFIPRPQRERDVPAPSASPPAATQPAATQPAATQPAATQPAATQPAATQPAATPPVVDEAARVALPVVEERAPADSDALLRAIIESDAPPAERLARLAGEVTGDCRRCKLHRGRTKLVFGVGNPAAELVFVGEGPGGDEDRQGIPFVGKAGQLLTKMIEAMQLCRDDVYICNVVKCRPPNNRDPEPDEVEACERFLKAQLAIVRPKVIVTLGKYAAQTLLREARPISALRGRWFKYEGIDLLPTFHPAYLLRSPEKKREAWDDLQQVMRRFGREPPRRG